MSPDNSDRLNKVQPQLTQPQEEKDFFVVGIGASAGGLHPLEEFFEHMPTDSGAAFVVIQHLSPDFKSLMKELLGRKTRMEIYRVENGMKLKPNAIYLIPPGQNLVVEDRCLQLYQQNRTFSKPNFPIDLFFKSLAKDCGEKAIAVVLSGSGSDGTHGIRSIHEEGGLSIVQQPETAEFDGMPQSAIATGIIDYILSPVDTSQQIYDCLTSLASVKECSAGFDISSDSFQIQQITNILARYEGIDFSHYKPSTLSRRIHRRCIIAGCQNLDSYINRLQAFPEEREILRNDLLISVTAFFRDTPAWDYLERKAIPSLLQDAKPNEELRFWVSACATGQEAYSLAILLDEIISNSGKNVRVKIFGTDIDRVALEKAASGIYPENISNDISPERLQRYFNYKDGSYQVVRKLREMLIFAPHDLSKDAAFTRMHLVTCRNVLIYMQTQLQQQVLRNLHFSLLPNGILVLGEAETAGEYEDEFLSLDKKWNIYQKRRNVRLPLPVRGIEKISRNIVMQSRNASKNNSRKEQMLEVAFSSFLKEHGTTCLLVDKDNQVIHLFEDLLSLLKLPVGRATMEVSKLVPSDLQLPLNTALNRAKREKQTVFFGGINLNHHEKHLSIDLKVSYHEGNMLAGDFLSVTISPTASIKPLDINQSPENYSPETLVGDSFEIDRVAKNRITELEYELQETRENLQATIEELETTNEEQQATNEELIASNEELQSTNEELHSVNEELHTVNTEYQSKIHELTELNDDVNNLLSSTSFGVLFLDNNLHIRKFTPAATKAINLREGDIGRSLEDITHNTDCYDLKDLILGVLDSKLSIEKEIKQVKDDIYMLMQINPYRQENGEVDGVVITFVDINELKTVQEEILRVNEALRDSEYNLRKSEERFRLIFEQAGVGIAQLATDGSWLKVNNKVCEITGYSEEELLEIDYQDITHPDDSDADTEQIAQLLKGQINSYSLEKQYIRKDGKAVWVSVTPVLVTETLNSPRYFITIIEDISDRKQAQFNLKETSQALREITERYELAVKGSKDGIWDWDIRSDEYYVSDRLHEILGYKRGKLSNYPQSFFSKLHPDDVKRNQQVLKEHLEKQAAYDVEFRLQNKRNEYVWVRCRGEAIRDEFGKPVRMAGSVSDIMPLKKVQENLRQVNNELILAKEKAEAANHAKSEFLAKMTHELRTPLNSILGFTQILNRQSNLSEQQRLYLDTVLRCGNHLLDLINEILEISKIEAGALELNSIDFDLYSIIDSLEQMLQLKGRNKGLQLNFELSQDVPQYIKTDEARLRQVLINLLGNAIKFTDKGCVCLQVSRDTASHNQNSCRLIFRIQDTGKGIAKEDLECVFNSFVQGTNNKECCDGTGLGLPISKSFIELMGGKIKIESTLGQGTTIEFDILATIVPNKKFAQSLPKARVIGLAPNQPKPLILIAEDNLDNYQLLIEILSQVGFETVHASNGQEAVEKWRENKPNLILMDMRMPVMDGYQATREIRKSNGGEKTTIIIAQTSNAFNDDERLIMSLGCDDFIRKPFKEEVLLEKIAHHLKINYIYSDQPQDSTPFDSCTLINSESLSFMPAQLQNQLHQTAVTCNKKAVIKVIEKIPEENESNTKVKQQLMNLANQFRFDEIASIITFPEAKNSAKM